MNTSNTRQLYSIQSGMSNECIVGCVTVTSAACNPYTAMPISQETNFLHNGDMSAIGTNNTNKPDTFHGTYIFSFIALRYSDHAFKWHRVINSCLYHIQCCFSGVSFVGMLTVTAAIAVSGFY